MVQSQFTSTPSYNANKLPNMIRPLWLEEAWEASRDVTAAPRPLVEAIQKPKPSRASNIWRSVTTRDHPNPEKNSPTGSTINIELRDIENQRPTQATEANPAHPDSNSSDSTVVHHSNLMGPVNYLWPCCVARYKRMEAWAHESKNPLAYPLAMFFFFLWLLAFPFTNIFWPIIRPLFRLIFFEIFGLFAAELAYAVLTFYQRVTMIPWAAHLIPREHELTNIERYWLGGWKRQVTYIATMITCVVVAVTFFRWFLLSGFLCPWLCWGPRGNGVDDPVYTLGEPVWHVPRTSRTTTSAFPTAPRADISTAPFAAPTWMTEVSDAWLASPWTPWTDGTEEPLYDLPTLYRTYSTRPGGFVVVPSDWPFGPGGKPTLSPGQRIPWMTPARPAYTPDIPFTNTARPTHTPDVVFTNPGDRPAYTPGTIWNRVLE